MPLPRHSPSILRSARGGFDLPSVIVGVIVVGILAAGTFAAVFGAIPWAQDRAAKQDLASLTIAEATAESVDGQYAGPELMSEFGYLGDDAGLDYAVSDDASCYVGVTKAATGKTFFTVNGSDPEQLTRETKPDCLTGVKYEKISTGAENACALAAGEIYCWGSSGTGETGGGTGDLRRTPTKVAGVLAGKTMVDVEMESGHVCALDSDQRMYCWGHNWTGQLGNGGPPRTSKVKPVAVAGILSGKPVTDMAVGGARTCAVSEEKLYCWGLSPGSFGLGDAAMTAESSLPVLINGGSLRGVSVKAVDVGQEHTCALSMSGKAHCWGHGDSGKLGVGGWTLASQAIPGDVDTSLVGGATFDSISLTRWGTCALGSGVAYCWGSALTVGGTPGSYLPRQVGGDALAGKHLTSLATGENDVCVSGEGSGLFCWGENRLGILEGGNAAVRPPIRMEMSGPWPGSATSVGMSYSNMCVTSDGAAYCRGKSKGLGNGSSADSISFVQVSDPVDAKTWVDAVLDGGKLP